MGPKARVCESHDELIPATHAVSPTSNLPVLHAELDIRPVLCSLEMYVASGDFSNQNVTAVCAPDM
jgi:hypothetical protein